VRGKNYRTHLEELKRNDLITETPQEPTAFVKLNSCPRRTQRARSRGPEGIVSLDYEPELCVRHRQARLGSEEGRTRSTTSQGSPS